MQDLTEPILELIRRTATDLPPDVEAGLRKAVEQEEPGSAAPPPSARTPARQFFMSIIQQTGARAAYANRSRVRSPRPQKRPTCAPMQSIL
jgi:hypothetical protein